MAKAVPDLGDPERLPAPQILNGPAATEALHSIILVRALTARTAMAFEY